MLHADLVVGAEGGNSPTVTALAGAPTARPTGLFSIAGSNVLVPGDPLPTWLLHGPGLAVDGKGTGLFVSLTGISTRTVPPHLAPLQVPASLVWGVIARGEAPAGAGDLIGRAVDLLTGWDPRIVTLVSRAAPCSVARYTFRAADPRRPLTPWQPGHVTALGDAVHCMPPTGGRAAATAIRDAGFLAEQLAHHDPTPRGIQAGVAAYESAMPTWALPAITESLRPVKIIRALRNPLLAAAAGPGLHAAAALASLRSTPTQ